MASVWCSGQASTYVNKQAALPMVGWLALEQPSEDVAMSGDVQRGGNGAYLGGVVRANGHSYRDRTRGKSAFQALTSGLYIVYYVCI